MKFITTRIAWRFGVLAMTLMVGSYTDHEAWAEDASKFAGRLIYEKGIRADGSPVQAIGYGQIAVEGDVVACVNCHKRSGMGGREANLLVPPVCAGALFGKERPMVLLDPRFSRSINIWHGTYDDKSLARALREGVRADGSLMEAGMPRYAFNDEDMMVLTSYLRQLTADVSPGVGSHTLRFATVIAPDTPQAKRDVVVAMLQQHFKERNSYWRPGSYPIRSGSEVVPRTPRDWELSVWELRGHPATWKDQLEQRYRTDPVFAILGGVAGENWQPVHDFCQSRHVPCVLPFSEVPPKQEEWYGFYYTKGVFFEAALLAAYFKEHPKDKPHRIIQFYRNDQKGLAASAELSQLAEKQGIQIENHVIIGETKITKTDLQGLSSSDALMFWLPQEDYGFMKSESPPTSANVYLSGLMSGRELAEWPATWKSKIRFTYPFELPKKRYTQLYPLWSWLRDRKIPAVNEQLQADLYYTMMLVSEIIAQMLDNVYQDYFVERLETTFGTGSNQSMYPVLSSGPNQRFASKTGYIAKYDDKGLVSVGEMLTPND